MSVAVVAAVLGFGGIVDEAAWIAKALTFVFMILFVVARISFRAAYESGNGLWIR